VQGLRDRIADATGCAGNQRRPARQIEHQFLLSATYSVFERVGTGSHEENASKTKY
jgi:hypothetical protein